VINRQKKMRKGKGKNPLGGPAKTGENIVRKEEKSSKKKQNKRGMKERR